MEEFPNAKVHRCHAHIALNVLAKVPKNLKKTIADEIRSIFYASTRNKALEFYNHFKAEWKKEIPSALKCLENQPYSFSLND